MEKRGAVAVVGSSAAGLLAAERLARAGRDTTVFERSPEIDPKPRTLIVTDAFKRLVGDPADRCVVNEISRFELYADGRVAEIDLDVPDLIIERSKLIKDLAEGARDAGAKIELGHRFLGLSQNGSGFGPQFRGPDRRETHAPFDTLIGADGARSRVARAGGWPALTMVPLVQALVETPADLPQDTTRVWFRPDLTPYFFWLIPEGNGRSALGVIGEDASQTRRALDRFLKERSLQPLEYQGAMIPAYSGWVDVHRRVGGTDVYLVGDAAGQVKVSTVGGIVTGFRGALAVVDAILQGGRTKELRSLRRELGLHLAIRRSMHHMEQDDYIRVLDLLNEPAQRALAGHSRDQAGRILWALARRRPQLLLRGFRGLLTGWLGSR